MKIYLTDQSTNFSQLLHDLSLLPVMDYDKASLKEKASLIELRTNMPLSDIDLRFFFSYQIFPPHIMSFLTQWKHEDRAMQVGDTIVQQVFIPPVRSFSQKIVVGVRINEIINEPDRKGYSYETLEGHVEKGVSTFTIEQHSGNIICQIKTFSEPGNILTKILAPVFSLPYQAYCTQQALNNVELQLRQ